MSSTGLFGFPFRGGSAAGDAVSPGCGVEAADSAATGVVAVAVGPSEAVGDCPLLGFVVVVVVAADVGVVRLRRQSATISSPRMVPKVSTFWKGGGGGFGGGGGESVLVCCEGGRVEAGSVQVSVKCRCLCQR